MSDPYENVSSDAPVPMAAASAAVVRGANTSEGWAAFIAGGAPIIVAALNKLGGWQLIAALGIAALVAIAYGGYRTLLKLRGLTAILFILFVLPAAGCAGCQNVSPKQLGAVATIATVETVQQGISVFFDWEAKQDVLIPDEGVAACRDKADAATRSSCFEEYIAPRFARIDNVRKAIRIYRAALAGGAQLAAGGLETKANDVISALATVGISVASALK